MQVEEALMWVAIAKEVNPPSKSELEPVRRILGSSLACSFSVCSQAFDLRLGVSYPRIVLI